MPEQVTHPFQAVLLLWVIIFNMRDEVLSLRS